MPRSFFSPQVARNAARSIVLTRVRIPIAPRLTGDRFRHREIGRVGREVAGVEAVRVAGLHHELLGALGIVGVRIDRQRELHVPRDDVAGDAREAELLGLVQGLAVDREAGGEPNPPVVPGRLRVPLLGEVEEEHRITPHRGEFEPGCPLDLFGHGTTEEVHHVGLTTLEGGGTRRLVGDALEDQPLDARRLPPVALERLDDDLDAGRGADVPVGTRADRRLLEPVVADLLHVLLRDDPARARLPWSRRTS